MIQDDEKFKTLRDSLRSLPRVKAKKDFEARLMQRIREANDPVVHVTQKIKPASTMQNWFANLFRPAFVPALGLTVVLLITVGVYFAFFSKMNDGSPENTQQFVSSTNQGDLIIYVKKDGDDISSNYPKEYSAVEPEDSRSGELFAPPGETPSDFMAKPDPSRTVTPELKPDRVSEEQKIEMQKGYEMDKDKGVDSKGERKIDDGIMKKDSKKEGRNEIKGEIKSETKKSEKKLSDEKKNIFFDDESDTNKEQENSPVPAPKKDETISNDNVKQQTIEEPENRISRATKKDSTKNKSDSEAEEKKIEQQK
jgi:hypothetical protein